MNVVLFSVQVSDLSIHDSVAVFTAILIARQCITLQDFVLHVAVQSLLAACPSGQCDPKKSPLQFAKKGLWIGQWMPITILGIVPRFSACSETCLGAQPGFGYCVKKDQKKKKKKRKNNSRKKKKTFSRMLTNSVVKRYISAGSGGDQDAEPGARLTCHLLLRLFSTSDHDAPSNGKTGGASIKSSTDKHLLSAARQNITVGAMVAVLKSMLMLGKLPTRLILFRLDPRTEFSLCANFVCVVLRLLK